MKRQKKTWEATSCFSLSLRSCSSLIFSSCAFSLLLARSFSCRRFSQCLHPYYRQRPSASIHGVSKIPLKAITYRAVERPSIRLGALSQPVTKQTRPLPTDCREHNELTFYEHSNRTLKPKQEHLDQQENMCDVDSYAALLDPFSELAHHSARHAKQKQDCVSQIVTRDTNQGTCQSHMQLTNYQAQVSSIRAEGEGNLQNEMSANRSLSTL